MIWIKRIASTPAPQGRIIDSFETGDDKSTNAPSIRATLEKLNLKAEIDDDTYTSDKTLSGSKIKQMFDSVDGVALDDTTPSTNTVYSSSKVMSELDALATNITTDLTKALLDRFYPVGCVVMSFEDMTDAQVINRYGGTTWERIRERYLIAAGSSSHIAGSTGGSSTVTLTTNNLPSHSHNYYRSNTATSSHTLTINEVPVHNHLHQYYNFGNGGGANGLAYNITTGDYVGQDTGGMHGAGGDGSHTHPISRTYTTTSSAGSGTAVNIEPPYIAVYMWRRTA